jgi:hypothetical protein
VTPFPIRQSQSIPDYLCDPLRLCDFARDRLFLWGAG